MLAVSLLNFYGGNKDQFLVWISGRHHSFGAL
jgi:hypothetical protein